MTDDLVERPADREQLIEQVIKMIRSAKLFVMGTIGPDEHMIVSSMGCKPERVPDVFRMMAAHVEREEHVTRLHQAVEQLPNDRKGMCPGCQQCVIVTTPIPLDAIALDSSKRALCVCTCGAFLVPYFDGERRLHLRFMTEAEVIEMPDDVRNQLLRVRRDFERLRAQREPQEKPN